MRALWLIGLLGCGCDKAGEEPADAAACAGCGADTNPPAEDTAAPDEAGDTAPAETGDSSVDTADTAADTAEPPEPCASATFTDGDGAVTDLTAVFTAGTYYTIAHSGTLTFCPGTWYVRLTIEADLAIVGLGETRGETVLSAGYQGTVIAVEKTVEVWIQNLTITQGASHLAGEANYGGGLRCRNGATVEIEDATFSASESVDGGAIATDRCRLSVKDADFVGNTASDDGGAVRLYMSDAAMEDVRFEGNTAYDGGAMMPYLSALTLKNATFEGNTSAYYAGAIWQYDSNVEIYDSTFRGNASGKYGGAIYSYGATYVEGTVFEDNTSDQGGALFYVPSFQLEGVACDFAGNTPDDVGSQREDLTLGAGSSFLCTPAACAEN